MNTIKGSSFRLTKDIETVNWLYPPLFLMHWKIEHCIIVNHFNALIFQKHQLRGWPFLQCCQLLQHMAWVSCLGQPKKSINGSLSFDDTFSVRVNASWKHCFLWTFILFFEWLIYIHHCPPVNNEGWHAEFHPLGENLLLFFEPLPKNKETVGHQNTVKSLATCEHYWII